MFYIPFWIISVNSTFSQLDLDIVPSLGDVILRRVMSVSSSDFQNGILDAYKSVAFTGLSLGAQPPFSAVNIKVIEAVRKLVDHHDLLTSGWNINS